MSRNDGCFRRVQMAVHAIGDRAVDEVLDMLADIAANNTGRIAERRHRVEHAQHLSGPEASASAITCA